ncbi:hypothetical protein CAPTEDRAFT_195062 [Capitella teleta]|uniref:VWFA domain-containing protein n=1 Tax=Capitella teleta TaxID=283909 RepID=R7UFN9_CAPTE|nr:hypothetical protein CAPTEDRAFT_195062 [Capitella teleta]|eukprot:ELU05020.1 hypothetical protein CAPTEDRAFT_195062 [Capitella teleta]
MDLSSKCKSLFVIHSCTLRDFMNDHRLEISAGNAFYQLNRPVTVEGFRKIIARKKSSVTFLEKDSFLAAINVANSDSITLKEVHLADFDVFVQSTSYTQLLNGGTEFLYWEEQEAEAEEAAAMDVNENGCVPSAHPSPVKVPTRSVGPPGTTAHEVVICFDTTGSMGACIKEVCKHAPDVFQHLFNDYPDLRIAPFAHGDYIDRFKYVTTFTDFTKDAWTIKDWMDGVETTYGGDWEECYELALHELSWTSETKRSLVMIGDAIPHEPHLSEAKLDWQAELDALVNDLGVRVYAVQHGSNNLAKEFWHSLAHRSGGKHLILKDFTDATDMLVGICHREYGIDNLKKFIEDVELREKAKGFTDLKKTVSEIFQELSTEDNAPSILREDSVVGKTVDFAKVKRRLAEMEEEETAKKKKEEEEEEKEEVVIAPIDKDASSRKRKMAPAEGESGTPVKQGKPLSAEEDLRVNGGKEAEMSGEEEESGDKEEENVEDKKTGTQVKKTVKKSVVKNVDESKKKKLDEKNKKIIAAKKIADQKRKLLDKKKKMAENKKLAEQKKKAAEKAKKMAEKAKKIAENAKKLAAAKKLAEQKKKVAERAKKLTESKKSVKGLQKAKTPAKKTAVKKTETKAKNLTTKKAVALKKPAAKVAKPVVKTSMSKRRAAQSASCAWEMLKKSPKSDKTAIKKSKK